MLYPQTQKDKARGNETEQTKETQASFDSGGM